MIQCFTGCAGKGEREPSPPPLPRPNRAMGATYPSFRNVDHTTLRDAKGNVVYVDRSAVASHIAEYQEREKAYKETGGSSIDVFGTPTPDYQKILQGHPPN